MQEAVSYKKVSGTSLPIYTKNPVQSSKATTKLSRFVEVNHIRGTIYIHKTTAVWLFQEGERVSADRESDKSNPFHVLPLTLKKSESVTPTPFQQNVKSLRYVTYALFGSQSANGSLEKFCNFATQVKKLK